MKFARIVLITGQRYMVLVAMGEKDDRRGFPNEPYSEALKRAKYHLREVWEQHKAGVVITVMQEMEKEGECEDGKVYRNDREIPH